MPPESIPPFRQGRPLLTCPPVLQRGHLAGWFQVGGSGALVAAFERGSTLPTSVTLSRSQHFSVLFFFKKTSFKFYFGYMGSSLVVHGLQSAEAWLPCSMWDLSSLTRDQTCVPRITRQTLNHWTTRESLPFLIFKWG